MYFAALNYLRPFYFVRKRMNEIFSFSFLSAEGVECAVISP